MKIVSGLFDHAVLQRTSCNVSDALISGTAEFSGPVMAQIRTAQGLLRGYGEKICGRAAGGKFSAQLTGLPAGGPYTVTLRIADKKTGSVVDSLTVKDVMVGDVWVVAGQSNAEGYGLLADRAKPHQRVRAFYMDDHWGIAEDPINCLAESVDQIHADLSGGTRPTRNNVTGTGLAVAFARQIHGVTGIPQGVIASAHGGSSMTQWDPAKKNEGSRSLYGATLRRVAKNGGKIAGIIWYQGESDCNATDAPLYPQRMKKLVASFRRDLGNAGLLFVCVQLSRWVAAKTSDHPWWNLVREAQRLLPRQIRGVATVPAIDLSLDDGIHISGRDQQVLGRRMGQAMLHLMRHPKAGPAPIEVKKITARSARGTEITVEFSNVAGRLEAGGLPMGFSLLDTHGNQFIYDTRLHGSRAVLYTGLSMADVSDCQLFYGSGTNPACNIHDSAGRSLPAFGPVRLGPRRAMTPFASALEVSALQLSAGQLRELTYPADMAALRLTRRSFPDRFTHVRPDFVARAPEDVLVFFRCPIICAVAMELAVLLGYDGPVKVWIDGQEKFADPDGINPAIPDHRRIAFSAAAGPHEILVGLGSNNGRAWGIFLRLERTDITPTLLAKGPDAYAMPQFILT